MQLGLEDIAGDLAELKERTDLDPDKKDGLASDRVNQRLSLPDHLPREDQTIDVPSDACPCCVEASHLIGERVNEMLDHVPAQLKAPRISRPKYGCRPCGTI